MINNVTQKVSSEGQSIVSSNRYEHKPEEAKTQEVKSEEKHVNPEDQKKLEGDDIKEAMERVFSTAKLFNKKIKLEMEQDLGIVVVKVIDEETNKVIRQIPPEEMVRLSKHAQDLKGLLLDKEG